MSFHEQHRAWEATQFAAHQREIDDADAQQRAIEQKVEEMGDMTLNDLDQYTNYEEDVQLAAICERIALILLEKDAEL